MDGVDPPAGSHWGAAEAEGVCGAEGGRVMLLHRGGELLSVAEGQTTQVTLYSSGFDVDKKETTRVFVVRFPKVLFIWIMCSVPSSHLNSVCMCVTFTV